MPFRPASRDIGEDRQDRELVIVVPKKKWIVPEQEETEYGDNCAGAAFNETSPVQPIAGVLGVFIHNYFLLLRIPTRQLMKLNEDCRASY